MHDETSTIITFGN